MLFTMFVLFLFGWLFFHSIGLALHLTWCAAKVIAALRSEERRVGRV